MVGIIGILIGFLFPVIRKARRTAIVLASPIAYVGQDNRVHVTDPSGGYDTMLLPVATSDCPICHSPPTWSPSGKLIAMQQGDESHNYTALLDPFAQVKTKFITQDSRSFLAWIDDEQFLTQNQQRGHVTAYEVNAATGQWRVAAAPAVGSHLFFVARAPANAPGVFIGAVKQGLTESVSFLKRDLSPARVVWREPVVVDSIGETGMLHQWPRVDANGEFVGWTQSPEGRNQHRRIAWKPVNARVGEPPMIINGNSEDICFCDWTEQGQILANRKDAHGTWRLTIVDRNTGRVLRELPTEVPTATGTVASWRKYGHQ